MIPQTRLVKSGLVTSRLAFGTSRLHYVDHRTRQDLMAQAVELGIIHFDTAPSYGDGLAERELGRFLKGRRSRLIIATKYGIAPDPLITAMPALAGPLRGVRAVARRAGLWQVRRPPLLAAGLRASVEASLRRIGTDVIDIVMLHEPLAARLPDAQAVVRELVDLRQRGLIRHFGLAGSWDGIASLGEAASSLGEIIQTGETQWGGGSHLAGGIHLAGGRAPDITFGALAQSGQHYFNTHVEGAGAGLRLREALARRPDGVVIVSTTKADNLHTLAQVAAGDASTGSRAA